jgi:hypothetical protein
MIHEDLIPFHNHKDPVLVEQKDAPPLTGVLLDTCSDAHTGKKPRTVYHFLPKEKIDDYKQASAVQDQKKMLSLVSEIDINNIVSVRFAKN